MTPTADEDVLTSVGIDIGTTTTQLVVSHLRLGSAPLDATGVTVTERELVHRGTVRETPLVDRTTVDTDAVRAYVTDELRAAGLSVDVVDTGAVIVTGETAYKENARELVHRLAADVGEFVIATAGSALEAVLAGKGSGAADRARRTGGTVANVDVGGGTTNVAIFAGDTTVETRCLDVGGRLVRFDDDGVVTSISDPAEAFVEHHGLPVAVGQAPDRPVLGCLVDAMATAVFDLVSGHPLEPLTRSLLIDGAGFETQHLDQIVFSGGVGRLLYEPTGPAPSPLAFDDLGPMLAEALRERVPNASAPVETPTEDINATVIGAGTRTTELSGTTIAVDDTHLPLRNLPVVAAPSLRSATTATELVERLRVATDRAEKLYEDRRYALFLPHVGPLRFDRLSRVADALVEVYGSGYPGDDPFVVVTEQDCAKVLAQRVDAQSDGPVPLVLVDEICPTDGDYLDVGAPILGGRAVPVVVKSLVFGA